MRDRGALRFGSSDSAMATSGRRFLPPADCVYAVSEAAHERIRARRQARDQGDGFSSFVRASYNN